MDSFTTRFRRNREHRRGVLLELPIELISRAQMEPWSEVIVRAVDSQLVIEAIQEDIELMEMYAEEFVGEHLNLLRTLGDEPCRPID